MLRHRAVKRLAAPLAIAALLAGCTATGGADRAEAPEVSVPSPTSIPGQGAPSPRSGPLEAIGSRASCAEGYSPEAIGKRAFAFDGTVIAVGPGRTNKAGAGQLDTAAVTFRVNEWFKSGSPRTVTVDLMAATTLSSTSDGAPSFQEGTRLLVSGEPRWGGEALDEAIAWSCGGFTRYYEADVADQWRAAAAP